MQFGSGLPNPFLEFPGLLCWSLMLVTNKQEGGQNRGLAARTEGMDGKGPVLIGFPLAMTHRADPETTKNGLGLLKRTASY